jgi:hypothetical protein
LPAWVVNPLFRGFAKRPGVDMATTTFTHIERLGADDDEVLFPGVESLEGIGILYGGHTLVMGAVTFAGATHFNFTWDEALYSRADADEFIGLFETARKAAFAEVSGDG